MLALLQEGLLRSRQLGRAWPQVRRVRPWNVVQVNPHDVVGVGETKAGGDAGTPVAALRTEAAVAQPRHEFDPQIRDSKSVHPAPGWAIGEAIARQRRDYH